MTNPKRKTTLFLSIGLMALVATDATGYTSPPESKVDCQTVVPRLISELDAYYRFMEALPTIDDSPKAMREKIAEAYAVLHGGHNQPEWFSQAEVDWFFSIREGNDGKQYCNATFEDW